MIPAHLRERVDAFLPTLRLGVDFGETAGGIALVRGNKILHAETFVDFHNATLETRRTLRRGRRTRRSKKMRLARLRSWVLRQKLPDGSRLPDPYRIMWDVEGGFQTMPGLYKTKGRSPREVDTWIEAAKKGEVDAAGFVCALTHLFQKRGYKYDDKELSEFSDNRLLEFLNSCCLLERAPDLAEKMRAEVERRAKPKLKEAFEAALTRQSELRKAMPRQIKEDDLRVMVEKFGQKHGLPTATVTRWKTELCGLLNRVLREARFDNRLKSGCTWCGKKTARLKKPAVREKAFFATLGNLRLYMAENSRITRALTAEERVLFETWWQRRRSVYAFAKGAKVPVFERAPTEDNLEKAFDQLRVVKSWLRDSKGKPYYGYAMLSQINNLLNHEPRGGRASLCMEHLQMAAEGKHMKDAGVEWQTLRVRSAPNPCREQHDARVLQRIERLLFLKGKKGEAAWRHGPVAFITLEVPEPQTEQVGKGQQTERRTKTLREVLWDETGAVCIYTGQPVSVEQMEKDHIVPDSKGGPDVRINLVCASKDANKEKDNRLPSEWLGYGSARWKEFEARVQSLKTLPEAKKRLLLLPPGETFPEDETPLAHVGARPRAFVADLRRLFEKYEVTPPKLDFKKEGLPHVQRVDGRWTRDLRMSWLWKDHAATQLNFPEKKRTDLYNHAQDAALLTATPPHTWRKLIQIETARRWCAKLDGKRQPVFDANGKVQREMRQRPGVALLELAPDWAAFIADRKKPLVTVLGRMKASWRTQLWGDTLYRKPEVMNETMLLVHKPLETPVPGGQQRETVEVTKGGLPIQVPYLDLHARQRRVRKMQVGVKRPAKSYILPQSVAAIFWYDKEGRFKISLERPKPIHRFVEHPIDPPIAEDGTRAGRWERGATIKLEADGDFAEGFYRVKELTDSGIIVIPERNVTAAIAQRMNLPKEEIETTERKLGKGDLAKLFPKP